MNRLIVTELHQERNGWEEREFVPSAHFDDEDDTWKQDHLEVTIILSKSSVSQFREVKKVGHFNRNEWQTENTCSSVNKHGCSHWIKAIVSLNRSSSIKIMAGKLPVEICLERKSVQSKQMRPLSGVGNAVWFSDWVVCDLCSCWDKKNYSLNWKEI